MKKALSTIFLVSLALFSFTSLDASMLNQEESFNNLVIFIKFADETEYTAPYSLEHYEDLFNGEDKVSLRDYYLEATYDQLTINSYLVQENSEIIWYQDTHDRSYYEVYDSNDNPNGVDEDGQAEREHSLLKRAVDYVDDNNLIPDDLILDSNDDGTIDSISFLVSGEDEGWNSLLWPHMWNLYSYQYDDGTFTNDAPSINGVYALDYTFELLGNTQSYYNQVHVGVLAHETFHLLSAPDLYHYYDYTYVSPVGDWGVMDSVGDIPSHMLGYMKYKYGGWIDEINTITESGTYTLYPLQDSTDNIYKIPTGYQDEYIYLEYRDDDGLYESTLPDTGLLVYRVNSSLYGNENGSYDDNGDPSDEVWIFRPGMDDQVAPIIIEDTDYYIDGDLNDAALSDIGDSHDSAGSTEEIKLFNGAGELINISISNVDEHDGYVTFDISLPTNITLNTKTDIPTDNVILLNHEAMNYTVNVNNLPQGTTTYYTLDGSTPTQSSMELTTSTIEIDAEHNIVSIVSYNSDGTINQTMQQEYTFENSMQSSHNPYGNNINKYWYLDFGSNSQFDIIADNRGFLEVEYDYLYLTSNNTDTSYTGDSVGEISETYSSDFLLINLFTDTYVEEGYGFKLELEVTSKYSFTLNGDSTINVDLSSTFEDFGYTLSGEEASLYTVSTVNNVDTNSPGTYTIEYNLLDNENNVVNTITRTVIVKDNTSPEVTLNGEETLILEIGDTYTEAGVTATDNYDTSLDIDIDGTVNTSNVGTTIVTYTVTDDAGNKTIVTRTVIVNDNNSPIVTLKPGIDTIYVGDDWSSAGINVEDDTDTTRNTKGTVDTSQAGEYIITYEVTDKSGNVTSIKRYVTVLENVEIKEITCDPFLSTTQVDVELKIGDCYVGDEKMNKNTEDVSYTSSGKFEIVYTCIENGYTYKTSQFIYVLNVSTKEVSYIERKEYL